MSVVAYVVVHVVICFLCDVECTEVYTSLFVGRVRCV